MKKSRYSDEQIVRILREADQSPIAEVAKRNGVSEQSIYAWRKRFGEMNADEVKNLKGITQENAMLKKLLAERDLEIEIMKEIAAKMVSAPARRIAALYAIERGASHRRACALMQVSRSTLKYVPTLPMKNAPVVNAMRKLSGQYPRYGYRRINVFLERDGIVIGEDKCGRLWAENGLQVPRKRPCRRIATSRPRPFAPARPNSVWSYDFVFDACANGQQVKCLTVVDEYTRECLAIDVARAIRSQRVIEVLSRLVSVHGAPLFMRSDNGPEFVSHGIPPMDRPGGHRHIAQRSGQALAKRHRRELQWQVPRRVPVPGVVPLTPRGLRGYRGLAASLQHRSAP